jgi:hypothetical protein
VIHARFMLMTAFYLASTLLFEQDGKDGATRDLERRRSLSKDIIDRLANH